MMLQHLSQIAASSLMAASVALLLVAAVADVAFRCVPNSVSGVLAGVGLGLRAMLGSLAGGLVAALAVFVTAAFCWRRGWIGGGDVKLLAAATLTVPPLIAPRFLLAVALAGGALAFVYVLLSVLLARGSGSAPSGSRPPARSHTEPRRASLLRRVLRIERWRIRSRRSLPYAAAIAAGAFFILIKQ